MLAYRNLTISFGGPHLLDSAGLTINKRERICLIGRNGEGKSTLLRIIAGQIQPDAGETEAIPNLRISKLDQEVPDQLEGSVFDIVTSGIGSAAKAVTEYHRLAKEYAENPSDIIAKQLDHQQEKLDLNQNKLSGRKVITVDSISYSWNQQPLIQDFSTVIWRGDKIGIVGLNGAGKTTLLNVLVLDEPTNDLDIETVELLEERLLDYQGTLLLVSHDRSFLNNIATATIALEGNGHITEYNGGCEDWLERFKAHRTTKPKSVQTKTATTKTPTSADQTLRKLSYKERETLEERRVNGEE